jgi:hypothetical protein
LAVPTQYPQKLYHLPKPSEVAAGPDLGHPTLNGINLKVAWWNVPGRIKPAGGGHAVNEVTKEVATVPVGITSEGPWALFDNASKFQFNGIQNWDSNPLFILAICHSNTADSAHTICQHGNNGGNRGWKMQNNWGARFRYTASGIAHYETAVSVTTSCSCMALTRRGTTGLKYSDHTNNGALALLATDTVSSNWNDQTDGTDAFHIGGIDSGAEYWDGYIAAILCGIGHPSKEQLQAILDDPWACWRRR